MKNSLRFVIVGHVDHGKSTLIGRLLYDSEALPEDKLAEIQKLLEEYKRRFEFAYFLDSFEEELKEACERAGVPDLMDKVADGSTVTTVDELVPFLEEKGHPALTMDPIM